MAFRVKRKTREVEEIPLSSTADIAFLLIVFFLAASALLELRGVHAPAGEGRAAHANLKGKRL